jgi:DNA-binding MarR family transcriptional regulator
MTAGKLSDESGLSTGAVTFLLDRLEAAGMVKRRRDTDDRRRVWVELVPAAQKRLAHAQQPIVEEMKQVTQRFKAEELAIVRDFMREAKEVFQRQVTGAARCPQRPPKDP